MILADTTIIIDYARGTDTKLAALVPTLSVAICGVVRAELLCGARNAKHRGDLLPLLAAFHQLSIPEIVWDSMSDNLAALRAKGITVPFPDAVIATLGIENDIEVWARDSYYRCNEKALSAGYVIYYFASPQFYGQLHSVMSQTTRDFVPISEQYRLFFMVPPLPEQHEIVRRVEALFKLADAIEKRVAAATARVEKLTQAILAKAFRGELVLTEAELARREGRDYEPASVLLERIKAEREQQTPAKPARKSRQAVSSRVPEA